MPNVSKSISQQRKAQLRQLLTEAINSMKRTRSEENPEAILTHLSSKLTSLEELKQLENMLRAYLVLEAKKSYTRKPFTGESQLRQNMFTRQTLDGKRKKKREREREREREAIQDTVCPHARPNRERRK